MDESDGDGIEEVQLLPTPFPGGDEPGVGQDAQRWYGSAHTPVAGFRLIANESWDDGLVWLRYGR